jgi:hypothetical protein
MIGHSSDYALRPVADVFNTQPFRLTGGILKVDAQLYQPTTTGPSARSINVGSLGWETSSRVQDTAPPLPKPKGMDMQEVLC